MTELPTRDLLLLLVPIPALGAFVLLGLGPTRIPRAVVQAIGLAGGVVPLLLLIPMAAAVLGGGWAPVAPIFALEVGPSEIALALRLDPLSAIVGLTVTAVGAAVFAYSQDYVRAAPMAELRRFHALMNLFLAAMLAMVLAGDSITLFLGWEMMGLCSFFLIASRVTSRTAVAAGRKAFVMTRVADAALLAALLLLFLEAGSVRLDRLFAAGLAAPAGRQAVVAALLLVGAAGKSAQFPFHSWLPSAMAGPTPVSALLHSATMVAAGAFLLALFFPLLAAVPEVLRATALLGVGTAVFGAVQAIGEPDLKRLLAWSSVSQIGFMLLAVGVGAPGAAIAHFVVHALFKSLLFLAAGDMAHAAGGSTAIAAVAGMWQRRPVAFLAFAAGAASLAGLPLVTGGFWSKEAILNAAFGAGGPRQLLWIAGLAAAVLTAAYAIRPVLVGLQATAPSGERSFAGPLTNGSLILLAAASLFGGLLVAPIQRALGADLPHLPFGATLLAVAMPLLGFALAVLVLSRAPVRARIDLLRRRNRHLSVDALLLLGIVRPYWRLVRRLAGKGEPREDVVGRVPPALLAGLRDVAVGLLAHDPLDRLVMAGVVPSVAAASAATRRSQGARPRDQLAGLALLLVLLLGLGLAWA